MKDNRSIYDKVVWKTCPSCRDDIPVRQDGLYTCDNCDYEFYAPTPSPCLTGKPNIESDETAV